MKKIYSLLFSVAGLVAMTSCGEDIDPVYVASNATPSQLTAINSSYVLSASSSDFATFNFTKADFGVNVAKTYALEASTTEDFASYNQLGTTTTPDAGITVTAETMNARMLAWNIEAETAATVYFRVRAAAMDESSQATAMEIFSNVISSEITPYSGERIYPSVYVIGQFCSWNWDTAQKLFSFSDDEVNYEGVIGFGTDAAKGFKISGITGGWQDDCNYGLDTSASAPESEANSITLITSGGSGNITCYSKSFYHFSFNKNTLVLTKGNSFDTIQMVGNAGCVTGWNDEGATKVDLSFDTTTQRFYADVTFTDGEIKFLLDGTTWIGGSDGVLGGDPNIKVTAGNYRVYVNMNNDEAMTYELNADDYGK